MLKTGILVALACLLTACTTNSLVIGYFYGRMDNRMEDRILEVASFDDAQKATIKASVDEFFRWHRQGELPQYEVWLSGIEREIASGVVTTSSIDQHFDTLRGFTKTAFSRSPFANSAEFLKTLTDSQVEEIADHFEEEDKAFLEWLEERKEEGGEAAQKLKRLDTIVKNVGRFGINLSDSQRRILADGLAGLQTDPLARHALWNRWEQTFLDLLGQRRQADFAQRVTAHLAVYQDQNLIHRPLQVAHNRRVSAELIERILASLDPRQRGTLLNKLKQIRQSILKVSDD